jgi:hypothetical protein
MSTFHMLARRALVTLLTLSLLGAPVALGKGFIDPPVDALSVQMMALSGTDLMLAGCQDRLQTLDTMLSTAGYGPMSSHVIGGTTLVARWYHPLRHDTVLAFAGWEASGNAFSATETPGLVRWNELLSTP